MSINVSISISKRSFSFAEKPISASGADSP